MPFLRAIASILFVAGIALVLAWPIVTAENELILRPAPFDGLTGITVSLTPSGSRSEFEATLDEGTVEGTRWALHVNETGGNWCFSFRTGVVLADDRRQGLLCTETNPGGFGLSMFAPASAELERSVYVAALPGDIEELRLRATDDLPLHGELYELPSLFETDASVLVVFLPPGTSIVSATAINEDGENVDLSRIVDEV